MAVLVITNLPPQATTDTYDEINSKVDAVANPPEGMIIHTVGVTDGHLRVVDVWESDEHFETVRRERLLPAFREVIGEGDGQEPDRESYELHNVTKP